ncbi:hypothetical protein [Halobellus captivus]|uniref:hypothetical protein n=1 Tax=Halobellus captivus TaxID=2592614 RepID=UPI0013967D9A|nr:hypothetical protein [Halobellus captivus]
MDLQSLRIRLDLIIWLLLVLIAVQIWPVLKTSRGLAVLLVVTVAVVGYWALHREG